jgi:hypothetical protein
MVLAAVGGESGFMPTLKLLLVCLSWSISGWADSALRIHLYDYAGVSGATLTQAQEVASGVLMKAGVRLVWAACPTADCERPMSPGVLQVRIIDRQMARKVSVTKECLGYALLSGSFSSIASVFYHKAVELEKDGIAWRGQILGAMLAHEIGHLLLGRNSHARQGIMRGLWEDTDVQIIARGQMSFSGAEGRKMAANVEARFRAPEGAR